MPRLKSAPDSPRAGRMAQPYRILVATAGEPESIGAIHVARTLARRKRARIHVLAVTTAFPHSAPPVFPPAPPVQVDESNRLATFEQARNQLATVPGASDWTTTAVVGWPGDRIVDAGTRWHASLIIVGAGKHGLFDRLIGSETAITIVRRSTVPVLVVPPTARGLPGRAVAAIDFTDSSITAARQAASLLDPDGVLVLLHASTLIKTDPKAGSMTDIYTAGAMEKLEELRARLHRETRRDVQTLVVSGTVVDQLRSYVEHGGCDLIALGGHDLGLIDRLFLGSTREDILRNPPCAVLVAPQSTTE
jgi:nucleotide-binding universal stress UspA family protein